MTIFKNEHVLVTGATGFAGSHLVEELLTTGAKVTALDVHVDSQGYFASQGLKKKAKLVLEDINNLPKMMRIMKFGKFSYVFHLAAQPIVDSAFKDPLNTLQTNIIGTANLLEAVRQTGKVKSFIFASSDKAYGKLKSGKYTENHPLHGDQPYEVSKSAADLICQSYFTTYQIPITITRFGNIYGEGDLHFSRIVPGIMKAFATNRTLQVRSNGKFIRDYLYVKDVARGYMMLAKQSHKVAGEAFNFGSHETLSVVEVIKKVEKALGKKIKYNVLNKAKNEIPYQSLNFSKIRKMIGWKPEYSLTSTAPRMLEWYRSYL